MVTVSNIGDFLTETIKTFTACVILLQMLFCPGCGNGRQSSDLFPGLLCATAAGPDGGICSDVFLEMNGISEKVETLGYQAPFGASAKGNSFTHVGGTVRLRCQPDVLDTLDKEDPGVSLKVSAWGSVVEAPPPFRRRNGG